MLLTLKQFAFRDCNSILIQRKWDNEGSKVHFESGVRMGNGTFNLMISLLPARVIKLLEFIGFSGNKQMGLQDLMAGSKMTGLRQVLCVMTLLGYHLIVCYVLSAREGDLKFCDDVLEQQLSVSCCHQILFLHFLLIIVNGAIYGSSEMAPVKIASCGFFTIKINFFSPATILQIPFCHKNDSWSFLPEKKIFGSKNCCFVEQKPQF